MSKNDYSLAIGTLTDQDIREQVGQHQLIVENFEAGRVRQACYELRASDVFYETAATREDKRVVASVETGYVLRPHCYVTAIVMEKIRLPANVLGRILTKGQLFSVGILPVNTYADPGFDGRLGITLYNASQRYLVLKPGQPIAKIEFTVLAKPVAEPYSGQHGYETEIWPIPVQHYADMNQLRKRGYLRSEAEEIEASYGPQLGSIARRFANYERKVWLQIGITVAGFGLVFALYKQMSIVVAIAIGVVTILIANPIVHILSNLSLPFRNK